MSKYDIKPVCRACLQIGDMSKSLYGYEYHFKTFAEIFQTCTSIQIDQSENLPMHLCTVCSKELINAYNFIEKCKASDVHLKIPANDLPKFEVTEIGIEPVLIPSTESNKTEIIYVEEPDLKFHCGLEFPVEVPTIHANKKYVCNLCNTSFDLKYQLKSHRCLNGSDAYLKSKSDLKKRKDLGDCNADENSGTYCCEHCGVWFFSQNSYYVHKQSVCQKAELNNIATNQLTEEISSSSVLRCSPGPEEPDDAPIKIKDGIVQCRVCLREMRTGSYQNHKFIHSKEKPYMCEICGKAFIQLHWLETHIKLHRGERKSLKCKYCSKYLCDNSSYKEHLTIHETEEEPVPCGKCDKVLRTKYAWKRHQVSHDKKYLCNICGRSFSIKTQYTWHINRHSGLKPYACNFCYKRFFSKPSLNKHLLRHATKRPYLCNMCDESFAREGGLARHKAKVHNTETQLN